MCGKYLVVLALLSTVVGHVDAINFSSTTTDTNTTASTTTTATQNYTFSSTSITNTTTIATSTTSTVTLPDERSTKADDGALSGVQAVFIAIGLGFAFTCTVMGTVTSCALIICCAMRRCRRKPQPSHMEANADLIFQEEGRKAKEQQPPVAPAQPSPAIAAVQPSPTGAAVPLNQPPVPTDVPPPAPTTSQPDPWAEYFSKTNATQPPSIKPDNEAAPVQQH